MKINSLLKFFLLFCALPLIPVAANAQNTKITITNNSISVKQLITEIEKQTDFLVLLRNNDVDVNRTIHLKEKSGDISVFLNEAFRNTDISYEIQNKYIVLTTNQRVNGQQTITGTVIDAAGEAIIGANITIKGTNTGTVTNIDGKFSLVADPQAVLVISFIGYKTQEIAVGNNSNLTITLTEDDKVLDEVVVVGYGTMQKKQVTSSITSLSARDLPQGVGGSSIATALQGKVAGLVMSGTSSPNSGNTFQLRGMASINTSRAPLIVIDGMPGGDIRTIVQEDIQSIDVLKDASAGAIYGTRATGGVILITTKQAKTNELKMSYTGELTFKQAFGKPDLLNAPDYVSIYAGAKNNYGHNTDWWDEALNDNPTSNRHVLTIHGGADNARIYATMMYDNNRGILSGDSRQDYAGRINTDFKLLKGWLDINTHISYRQAKRNQNKPSIEGIMRANPTQNVYDPNSQTGYNIWTDGDNTEMNEIGEAALKTDEGLDKWFRPDVTLKLNILPIDGLSYRQTIGYENRQWEKHYYRSMFSREEINVGRKGWAELEFSKTELLNTDGYLSYLNDFGDHSINAVAGYSYFEQNNENFNAKNGHFTNDLVKFWNIGEGARLKEGLAEMGSSKGITQRLLAYFARANYSWKDTYMATASARREGSSKFAAKNRWGNFWSASAGWRLSNEAFLKDVGFVDDLKLRLAYGVTGNEGFSADYAAKMYGSDTRWLLPDGSWAYSYGVTKNINDMLGWEEKHEWNIGLDYSLFNNRVYGKFDLYRRNIEGLIYNVQVPQPPNTESNMYKNIGTMKNSGWELEIGADVVRSKNWNYSTSLNLSHNETEIGTLWGNQSFINGSYINNWVQYAHRIEEGTKVGSYFIYPYAGVSDDGHIQIYNKDGKVIDGDAGSVNDRIYQGNFMPAIMAGWTHNLSWKNWSLNLTLTSWIGYDIYNGVEILYGLKTVAQGNMLYDAIEKNRNITGRPVPCDYFLYDGSFLKIQNFTLGYTLPMRKYSSNLVESVKLYVTGNDVYTFTNYRGLTPEVDITGWDTGIEKAGSIYPQTRTFTFGLQLNF